MALGRQPHGDLFKDLRISSQVGRIDFGEKRGQLGREYDPIIEKQAAFGQSSSYGLLGGSRQVFSHLLPRSL